MTDQRITWFSGERPVNGSGNTVFVKPDADQDRRPAVPARRGERPVTPWRTPTRNEVETIIGERDRYRLRIDAIADMLDIAEDGFATVVRIDAIRAALGREYVPRRHTRRGA